MPSSRHVEIKELELGDQFPEIKTLRVHNVELDDTEGLIENLDLLLEIHYTGNFRTSIDADMVLGKKGSLTLRVKQLSGLARLQFTRKPYTHWSLSFLGDPEIDLAVESKYQGRQMQSNITSLISNQIRKAVRRKHTLPNYKLRYKPFFHKTPEEDLGDNEIQSNGLLDVKVSELSRLMCPTHITDIYCTLTMASLAFVEARQKDDRNVIVSLDVEIHKAKNQQIGIIFKQTELFVEIDAVLPNTPACKSNLRSNDVLIAIEGKRVSTIQQVAKIVKALQTSVFTLRIERVIPGIIRNDAILEDLELYEDLGDLSNVYSSNKPSDNELSVKYLATRHGSGDRGTSSESSLGNTPTSSPKRVKLIPRALKKTISRDSTDSTKEEDAKGKAKLTAKVEEKPRRRLKSLGDSVNDVEHFYQHSTIDCRLSRLVNMEDLSNFKLDAQCKYLNCCVYGKCSGDSLLLGFVNIPINQILAECCETSLTHCWKKYELNPPMIQNLKSHELYNQSGFNANLCYGDILFAFSWDGNPNLAAVETPSKQAMKIKTKNSQAERHDDSGFSDNISIKSTSTDLTTSTISLVPPRAHNFIRTHFQRATQCDFCGKKIWLKDAVQCRECFMCCHKKCVTKCQNSTVCGPVDCTNSISQTQSYTTNTPEFTVTEATAYEATENDEIPPNISDDEQNQPKTPGLEVHRSSLSGLLAQGIKRVNSANNLAIPGIVSTFAGGNNASSNNGNSNNLTNTKSLPPSPQRTPSRKASLICTNQNPFEQVTQRLEQISAELTELSAEQISCVTEPIILISKEEDLMTLAKTASKNLYCEIAGIDRVDKINLLLSKLRLALDSETAVHSSLSVISKTDSIDGNSTQKKLINKSTMLFKSEERVQALSVIMLYLCTGLQHAQGVASQ
ncbi:PDZ domain-containing protein 8-like [Teleopsis dalmanni]|uniref:PDZ domain-containing protein 8-like n=1 Tax=Teleopsis dalmanni TaxID=139649 RepID=UPI0018CE6B1F|nr:PDZ domain-containing protein 8-like [Teleopsis dalmanni]